jgi:hypothetical protein
LRAAIDTGQGRSFSRAAGYRRLEEKGGGSMRGPHERGKRGWLIVSGVLLAFIAVAVIYYAMVLATLDGTGPSNENAEILRNLVWPH